MKKIIIVIAIVVIVLLSIFYVKYMDYKQVQAEIKETNLEYEMYNDRQVDGRELTTLINKAIDSNEKNSIEKDENGLYIENDTNSVKIDIQMIDVDYTYNMETIYNGEMTNFIQMYNSIYFKCEEIKYNSAGRVKYMKFIQVTT